MNRQTRAMVQPVLTIDFRFDDADPYPRGNFSVKNLGAQPAFLLNMRLRSRRDEIAVFKDYGMYERHIMPPEDTLSFRFDFTEDFTTKGYNWWTPGICSFNLEVVASDLSEEVILAYKSYAYGQLLSVKAGMPLRVRWKFFYSYFRQRYFRILYKFKPPTSAPTLDEAPKREARQSAWLKRVFNRFKRRSRGSKKTD